MGPQAHQRQSIRLSLLVDEDRVGLYVAVAMIRPPTAQRVIARTSRQRSIVCQRLYDGSQIGVERGSVLPP